MHREPGRGDADHLAGQPRGDHPPADQPLQPPEQPEAEQPRRPSGRDPPADEEPQKAERPDRADDAAELAVAPFPPVNHAELVQRHRRVDVAGLRARAVLRELRLPGGGIRRRQRPGDRAPLGDREPRVGQPRHATDRDHRHHKGEEQHQPGRHRAPGRLRPPGGRRGRGLGLVGDLLEDTARLAHGSGVGGPRGSGKGSTEARRRRIRRRRDPSARRPRRARATVPRSPRAPGDRDPWCRSRASPPSSRGPRCS